MKAVIAGGSGSLGQRLADDLAADGYGVTILTRRVRPEIRHRQVAWDGRTAGDWASELSGALVVNLAGELVDRRPTARNIDLLRRSRVEPTQALVEASKLVERAPTLWLQMSTLAIYGDAGQTIIDESHPPAEGPPQMAGVARPWEEAATTTRTDRLVMLRTGVVLDPGTPALERLARITRFGLGGRIGRGDQWVSWIHVDDFLAAVRFLCRDPELHGVIHVTSPNPVQNIDMMATLRSQLHRPWTPPTPTLAVRAGAVLMRTDPGLALTGRRCVPKRLIDAGFEFEHPAFDGALADLLASR